MNTLEEILKDVENDRISIKEFMDAIGAKPIKREGDILIYNAPYNLEMQSVNHGHDTAGKPTCLVDTKRNLWCDKNFTPWQPLDMLVLELTWIDNPDRLKYITAHEIFDYRQKLSQRNSVQDSTLSKFLKMVVKPREESITVKPKRKMRF